MGFHDASQTCPLHPRRWEYMDQRASKMVLTSESFSALDSGVDNSIFVVEKKYRDHDGFNWPLSSAVRIGLSSYYWWHSQKSFWAVSSGEVLIAGFDLLSAFDAMVQLLSVILLS
jgi:hypothetical protein